jgi:tetratricopeptide (TPR) repeat protein
LSSSSAPARSPPDARVLWLASRAYDQQWQRLDALEEAVQRDPRDPWLRLQRARARYDSAGDLHVTQTLRDLDALIKEHPDFVAPRLLKVQLLQDEGLTQAAFALAWETTQQRPDHPDALRVAFGGAEEAGWPDRLLDLCQQQLRWDAARVSLYGPCATALLKRGRPDEARALLQRALALRPDITGFWGLVADLELALGNPAGAEQALRQMTTLLPDDAQAWARLGKHLAEHGAPDKAAEALSLALTLEPQNAELQEYLAFLKPSAPALEEDFVLTPDPLSPEDEQARYPNEDYVYLIDQQVTRVFPNGLSSRFVQQVARVRTDNGVASLRNLQIAYTPGEERVDILKVRITRPDGQIREVYSVYEQSLSEPWYNLYYDYRAMIISLPDLGRGDTVELQYKLTQISARNVLGDYFGDIWFAQESAPKALARYTLLLPPERQIQARAPSLPGCAAQTQDRAATDNEPALKVHTWTCAQVPGVKNEPDRPGFSQVADYLHLSTWSDWGALARWYWDLIEDQLVVDAEIRRLVAELTSGLADPRQKVSAIHNYVVQNTRYVGLEFGIHGFKPYRTTQCLRRRFGDCKDKASLLKVMLQEAGVEADLVLIRTRNNGAIDANPPSLQIFDHAITYVPAFDLFLDGTAEYSGTRELPWGDQGAQVLIVKNGGAFRVAQTPILPPSHNAILTSARVDLQPDEPVIDASHTITGDFAASYRRAFETEQSRQEVFTRQLSQDHPGARVSSLQFSDLHRLEEDVRLSWRATAPALAPRDPRALRVLPALRLPRLQQRLAPWTRRELPLELGHPYTTQETYELVLPRGAEPASPPADLTLDSAFGSFSLRYKWTPQTPQAPPSLRVEVLLEVKRHTISPDEYPALRQWLGQIDQTLGTALVFVRK